MLVEYYEHRPDSGATPSYHRSLVHAPVFAKTTDLWCAFAAKSAWQKRQGSKLGECFSDCTFFLFKDEVAQGNLC